MKGLVQHGKALPPKQSSLASFPGSPLRARGGSVCYVLTAEEEVVLVGVYGSMRLPTHSNNCDSICVAIAKRNGKADWFNLKYGPSKHWRSNFRKRHHKLIITL